MALIQQRYDIKEMHSTIECFPSKTFQRNNDDGDDDDGDDDDGDNDDNGVDATWIIFFANFKKLFPSV